MNLRIPFSPNVPLDVHLPISKHMQISNAIKDAYEEISGVVHDEAANELIQSRSRETLVWLNRLRVALEYDLTLMVPDELDPRDVKSRVYFGKTRFYLSPNVFPNDPPDAFLQWREIGGL